MKQREIKFRCWEEEKKCFAENAYPMSITKGIFMELNSIGIDGEEYKGNVIFQQYTGFEDKNGKEIYEGDIVHREINPNFRSYESRNWMIYYGTWCYMRKDGIDSSNAFAFDTIDARSNCEVIGNIFENPELIKQE